MVWRHATVLREKPKRSGKTREGRKKEWKHTSEYEGKVEWGFKMNKIVRKNSLRSQKTYPAARDPS